MISAHLQIWVKVLSVFVMVLLIFSIRPEILQQNQQREPQDPSARNSAQDDGAISSNCVHRILRDAETVWQVSKDKRSAALSKLGSQFHDRPWGLSNDNTFSNIWDLFTPAYHCPRPMERVGHFGDGGKWICGFTHVVALKPTCLVYSYGINQEITFEEEIMKRSNCSVRMLDYTVDDVSGAGPSLAAKYPDRAWFYKVGVGGENSVSPPLRTIASEMALHGDTFIDILKVDVEGAELAAFEAMLEDFPATLPFAQLQVELHPGGWPGNPFENLVNLFGRLEERGLRAVFMEFTQIPLLLNKMDHMAFVDYAFINTRIDPDYFYK